MTNPAWLDAISWNENGLVPAMAQDAATGRVLMMAWMSPESLVLSVQEKRAVYWSRSRQSLWRKGESSGHVQQLEGVQLDCDGDTLLLKVTQRGGIACHTGRESCFYRSLSEERWQETEPTLQSPEQIYSKSSQ